MGIILIFIGMVGYIGSLGDWSVGSDWIGSMIGRSMWFDRQTIRGETGSMHRTVRITLPHVCTILIFTCEWNDILRSTAILTDINVSWSWCWAMITRLCFLLELDTIFRSFVSSTLVAFGWNIVEAFSQKLMRKTDERKFRIFHTQ